jgi:hypothetical protein
MNGYMRKLSSGGGYGFGGPSLRTLENNRAEKYLLPKGSTIWRLKEDSKAETFTTTKDAFYDIDEIIWPTLDGDNDGHPPKVVIYLPQSADPYNRIVCLESSLVELEKLDEGDDGLTDHIESIMKRLDDLNDDLDYHEAKGNLQKTFEKIINAVKSRK